MQAQAELGKCYAHRKVANAATNSMQDAPSRTRGVAQDWVQAVAWFRRAAEQGHAEAQHNLGACYQLGDGPSRIFLRVKTHAAC